MAKQQADFSDIRQVLEPDQSLFKFSLIGLIGFWVVIALTSVALYLLVVQGSNSQLSESVYSAKTESYVQAIDQQLSELQARLQHYAERQEVSDSLLTENQDQQKLVENHMLTSIPNINSILLLPSGLAMLQVAELKLSLAEVDMINRAEKGQSVPAEAHKLDNATVLRMVQAVRQPGSDEIIGVMLAGFDLDALTDPLFKLDSTAGSMQLEQQFSRGNVLILAKTGNGVTDTASAMALGTSNPYWQVRFQPSPQLTSETTLPWMMFWLPIAFAVVMTSFLILTGYFRLRTCVRADAIKLVNLCRDLLQLRSADKVVFETSLFSAMAQTLLVTANDSMQEQKNRQEKKADNEDPPFSANPIQVGLKDVDLPDDSDLDDLDLVNVIPDEPMSKDKTTPGTPQIDIPADIFRAYDIRGIMDTSLNTDIAYRIGQAIGSAAAAKDNDNVVVGADGRLSSPELLAALVQGLRDTGRNVINIGTVPTPLVYYGAATLDAKSGVMITGSHNPPEYNGFKIVIDGTTLANEAIQDLYRRICEHDFVQGAGDHDNVDILDHYLDEITNDIVLARPLKVVVDCGNGVASVIAPRLLEALGCEVIPLFCQVDGRFPNHHPDPGKPENLQNLIAAVKEQGADVGLAFDGDGDRLGVVTNLGNIVWPDRLLMLFAKDVASRNPGADIIYDVKCSRHLASLISEFGGRPIMWKTGHSLIKAKMKETGALLAGEMSGHIFFKERWHGFDDGIYSAARLLELLAMETLDADSLFNTLPNDVSTPEINIKVTEATKFPLMEALQAKANFEGADISTIDGIRADYSDGWGLVRASNTTPVLVLRFEAESQQAIDRIQLDFRDLLLSVDSTLNIPF